MKASVIPGNELFVVITDNDHERAKTRGHSEFIIGPLADCQRPGKPMYSRLDQGSDWVKLIGRGDLGENYSACIMVGAVVKLLHPDALNHRIL